MKIEKVFTPSTLPKKLSADYMETFYKTLKPFFILSFLTVFIMLMNFVSFSEIEGTVDFTYMIVRSCCYSMLYLFFPLLFTCLLYRCFKNRESIPQKFKIFLIAVVIIITALPIIAIYVDFTIYELYGYHFNSFIWNIIITKGGIEALGSTGSTSLSAALSITSLFLLVAALYYISFLTVTKLDRDYLRKLSPKIIILSMFIVLGLEELTFAYSKQIGRTDILKAASFTPFSLPTSMTKIFNSLGVQQVKTTSFMPHGKIAYPLAPIVLDDSVKRPNIIILTAESFRWDLLDPEITPNLWQFSQKSLNFTNHYSGGNRTRMGMFSLFYGLYAPYWYPFEKQEIKPVTMDVISKLGYQIELNTSQSFSYPELNHTLFTGIDKSHMHELQKGESWQRDVDNISMIMDMIDKRDKEKPFFNFMFFESTHAPYNFPKEAVIRPDFEPDVNYMKISSAGDKIYRIHNRYINAAHHIDAQVGKLLKYLTEKNLLENTIVLFTGDHGEEFMEKGRWGHGHNARFTTYQTRVPFVLYSPGEKPAVITTQTNHLQFPAYLLSKLGVLNNYRDYSLAPSLMDPRPDYFVIGNYNYITIQDEKYKVTFPFTGQDYFHYNIFEAENDNFVLSSRKNEVLKEYKDKIENVSKELKRFYQKTSISYDGHALLIKKTPN